MGEAGAHTLQVLHQLGRDLGHPLHVAAVAGVQDAAGNAVAGLEAVPGHLRALAQHLGGDGELLQEDRGRPLLAGQIQRCLPAGQRHLAGNLLRELHGLLGPVAQAEHGERRPQAEEAHAVAALAQDLVPLPLEGQAVDLDHVVQHPGKDLHDPVELVPVEARGVREGLQHELGQVDGAQQAGAVGRQRLLAAGIGGPDGLVEPVVVHLVDPVNEHEAGLGEVIGRRHDHVPQAAGGQLLVDPARHLALVVGDVAIGGGPVAPEHLVPVVQVQAELLDLAGIQREGQRPVPVVLDGLHEPVGHQQGEVELAQPPVFPLGPDEVEHVGVTHVEGAHLGATSAAGRRHREAHLVVDIHEGHGAGGVRAGAGHIGALGPERRELVADAAAGLQGEAGLVDLGEDVLHGIPDGAGHRAVDRGGGGLVLPGAGIGNDATGRNGTAPEGPQELLEPPLPVPFGLDVRKGPGDTLVGVVHGLVDHVPRLRLQPVLLVPDVDRGILEADRHCP